MNSRMRTTNVDLLVKEPGKPTLQRMLQNADSGQQP